MLSLTQGYDKVQPSRRWSHQSLCNGAQPLGVHLL